MFSDVDFLVGEEETRIPAHSALVAARSQFLRTRVRQALEVRDKMLEKVHILTDKYFGLLKAAF